ncbi:hypothetical protein FKM82_017674 [Ascaphus truei]
MNKIFNIHGQDVTSRSYDTMGRTRRFCGAPLSSWGRGKPERRNRDEGVCEYCRSGGKTWGRECAGEDWKGFDTSIRLMKQVKSEHHLN